MKNRCNPWIVHKKLCMVSHSYTEKVCLSRESKCQKYFFQKNCSNIKTFLINHGSKKGLNLTMHIFGLKHGEKPGKIRINRSDKLEIFAHPLADLATPDLQLCKNIFAILHLWFLPILMLINFQIFKYFNVRGERQLKINILKVSLC